MTEPPRLFLVRTAKDGIPVELEVGHGAEFFLFESRGQGVATVRDGRHRVMFFQTRSCESRQTRLWLRFLFSSDVDSWEWDLSDVRLRLWFFFLGAVDSWKRSLRCVRRVQGVARGPQRRSVEWGLRLRLDSFQIGPLLVLVLVTVPIFDFRRGNKGKFLGWRICYIFALMYQLCYRFPYPVQLL